VGTRRRSRVQLRLQLARIDLYSWMPWQLGAGHVAARVHAAQVVGLAGLSWHFKHVGVSWLAVSFFREHGPVRVAVGLSPEVIAHILDAVPQLWSVRRACCGRSRPVACSWQPWQSRRSTPPAAPGLREGVPPPGRAPAAASAETGGIEHSDSPFLDESVLWNGWEEAHEEIHERTTQL